MRKLLICMFGLLCYVPNFAQKAHLVEKKDSIENLIKKQEFRDLKLSIRLPIALIGAGLLSYTDNQFGRMEIAEERNENLPYFKTNADDYLQYAPIASVYALNALGLKGKHDLKNRTALLLKSEALMMAIVLPMKKITHQLRPDGVGYSSFPSGHTAQAFVAATFMHKEYGYLSPWYSISAYAMASSVGILRILNNRHYSSDVLVGAGIGILTTNITYMLHKDITKKPKKTNLLVMPSYDQGNIGMVLNLKF